MAKTTTDAALNETNFREFADKVIAKYGEQGEIVNAMLWGAIIAHYERALSKAPPEGSKPCNYCKGRGYIGRPMSHEHRLAISKAHSDRCDKVDLANAVAELVADAAPEVE